MFILGFWFLLQFLNALVSSGTGGGVAWYAHVGGFVAGAPSLDCLNGQTCLLGAGGENTIYDRSL